KPFVCRFGGFEIDVVNAGLGQRVGEVLGALSFSLADAEKQHLDLFVERGGIGEGAAARRLGIECSPAAAASAEATEVGEFIQVLQSGGERLAAAHGESG